MIVSGRNISWKSIPEGETVTILDSDESNGLVGFNDITTDSAGRVYAGSLGSSPVFEDGREPTAGELHLIDTDGSARVVAVDIMLTNGLAFSPDGTRLYHSDSSRQRINVYEVDDEGSLGRKQVFAIAESGSPDGLCVSEDGRIWVALAGGHGVGVFTPDGEQQSLIEIPQPMCTSVCFGGDDLQDLYIVSGSQGMESDNAGAVYRTRADVRGLPVPPTRISL
ncbi:MAG: SMP-30/gluconolactonase/LRE family protein [Proteobacteria bacterium]|nr:SMP-30/gluconolactonase/LRE family protein [Pseudomonadota bacterium]